MLSAMTLTCPRCEEPAADRPATELTCRACGHSWLRPLPIPMAYLLRRVDGEEPTGPFTRSELRQMLYTKSLTGREKVRVPGHDVPWQPLSSQEAFSDILGLLDIQVQRTGRIQGWQAKNQPAPAAAAPAAAPVTVQEAPPPAPVAPRRGGGLPRPALIAVAVIIGLAIAAGLISLVGP